MRTLSTIAAAVLIAACAASAACVAASDAPGESSDEKQNGLQYYQPPPPPLAFPPPNATYCGSRYLGTGYVGAPPVCTIALDGDYLEYLGCSATWREVDTALPASVTYYTLCPDNATVRAYAASNTRVHIDTTTCNACVPRAPSGDLYLVHHDNVLPGCESGCGKKVILGGP
jgi:hypothetical protein